MGKQAFAAVLSGVTSLGDELGSLVGRPIHKLAALGMSGRRIDEKGSQLAKDALREALLSSLGVDLVAFKVANRPASKGAAETALADILGWPTWWPGRKVRASEKQRPLIARWAIYEWAVDICPTCQGATIVATAGKRKEGVQPTRSCPTCNSTGKRRYTDSERVDGMGAAYPEAMDLAHRIISHAEALAIRRAAQMLGRW